ncbi:MAG: N-6 DNA methylase [Bacteroidales bacterium]|nr:N-6 DNA methylase [Bacteroidales bacterium]
MSEELLQRDLIKNPEKIGKWDFYNIGATSVKALKEYGIIRNVNYENEEKKKIDGLIVQKKNVIAVIEYKKPSEFKTLAQKNKAIKQELEVARKLDAHIIIATDTKDTVWVNVATGNRIKDEKGKDIKTNFDPKDEKLPNLIEKIKYSINELNDQLKPKELVNPTDLAKQIWQDIWSVSGATPENCLYTFVELFIFKYLSDLGILQGIFNFNTLYDSFNGNTEDEVLETYASIIRPKIKTLFPENPIDKTTIINGTIFVSKDQKAVNGYSTVFKKVLGKFKDYGKLEHIDYDFKSQLFESFLKESISKKNWGQFFTPLKVVRAIVEMAKDDIKVGAKICDPACGVGKFLLEPVITKLDQFYEIKKGKLIPKITIHGYDKGFDKDEQKTIILAKANMLIYFSDLIKDNSGITTEFSKLFNNSFLLKTNSILGTLSEPVENEYDLIVTNPPYVSSGSSNLKEEIKKDGDLVNYYKINALGVEGLFMEWIIRALKPNGKAFVVVPDGIFDRRDDKNLRKFIVDECFIDGIISLPLNTFFTTQKKTYILVLTKKANKEDVQTEPVFSYLVSEIGESRDVYRFDIEQDDLKEAVTLYSFFKGNKKGFEKINSDKRCKIVAFDFFENNINKNWIVDKLWSNDEKIDLNILEKDNKIKFQEFPFLLDEISNTISTLKAELLSLNESGQDKFLFKEFLLSEVFTFPSIKGLTKRFIQKNSGDIPVYGGRLDETPIGYVTDNLNGVKYFENCLGWNREGSVGYVFLHKHKFTTNDHHRPLIVKPEYIDIVDLEYMRVTIQEVLLNQGFRWSKTASKEKVKELFVKIPITKKGKIDLIAQNRISERYSKISEIKNSINKEFNKLTNTNIDFE